MALADRPGRVYSRAEMAYRARGHDFVGYERTVDAHIRTSAARSRRPGEPALRRDGARRRVPPGSRARVTLRRPFGVRVHLVGAAVALAVVSVAVTGVFTQRAVDRELGAFAQRDLQQAAARRGRHAAFGYRREGGWTRAWVVQLRPRGARRRTARWSSRTPRGRVVGPAPSGHRRAAARRPTSSSAGGPSAGSSPGAGRGRAPATASTPRSKSRLGERLVEAGVVAGVLALMLALHRRAPHGPAAAAPDRRRAADGARRDRDARGRLRRPARDHGARPSRSTAWPPRCAARTSCAARRSTTSCTSSATRSSASSAGSRRCRTASSSTSRTALDRIARDARRLNRLVDDVLAARRGAEAEPARPQAPDRPRRRRPRARRRALRRPLRRPRHRASTCTTAPARVDGDPERLAQIVDNLLSNALRYTDPGGQVAVRLAVRDGEAVLRGDRLRHRHRARAPRRASSTASGATRRRARASPRARGVGLALVRDLVLAHDGRVEVESRPGEGSRFSVFLPIASDPAQDAPLVREPAAPAARRPQTARWCGACAARSTPRTRPTSTPSSSRRSTAGAGDVVLDLGDVTFIDSSGLGLLVEVAAEVRTRGGHLTLVPDRPT